MLGLAIMAIGVLFLWAALTGKADKVFSALQVSLPAA